MSGQQGEPAIGHSHVGEFRNNNQNSLVGEVRSNNQCQQAGGGAVGAVTPDGDANANQLIKTGEGGSDGGGESTGRDVDTLPPLMSQTTEVSQTVTEEQQNHIIIWGTDSQCDDPDLAEFEMLECQELEAYLVEEEEEEEEGEKVCEGVGLGGGVKEGAGQILLDQPVSIVDIVSDSREGGGRRTIQRGSSEQDVITMGSGGTRGTVECVARTEFSSENHALLSRLSTMSSLKGSLVSALDTAGRKQATATDSWHVPSGPSVPDKTISEDLTLASQSCTTISDRSRASQQSKQPQAPSKSTIQRVDLNLNQNTTVRSEEVVVPEAQVSNNVVVGRCKCQQNMEEDQGNEEHNNNLQQRYREAGGTGGKAVEDHQDARGTGGKAAEDHKEARGTGGKAVEDHQDARGTGGKAVEDHQDARGTGGKAAEDHKEARGTGGKAVEDHQETRGTGGKAVEDDKEARGTGGKAADDHEGARGSGGKAAEDHKVIPPDMNHNSPAKSGTNGIQSVEPRSLKKHGSFGQSMKKTTSFEQSMKKTTLFENTTKKSASFDRSLKKEPFLDRTSMKEASFDRTLRKQGSFEHSSSPSSLEGRKPWGSPSRSPSRPATPPWSPRRPAPSSPAKTSSRPPSCTSPAKTRNRASSLDRSDSPQRGTTSGLKAPSKVCVTSSIPKPISLQQTADPKRASPLKPKPARPKIITYVRKTPQVKDQSQGTEVDPNEALTLPPRLSSSHPSPPTAHRKPHKGETHSKASQVLCSSNILFDKYRQEMQKAGYFSRGTGMTSLVMKPPSQPPLHNHSGKSESIYGELHELAPAPLQLAPQEWTSLYRSPRPRGPQLGLGAVTRQPAAAKTRTMFQTQGQTGQRSGVVTLSHQGQQQAPPGNNQGYRDSTADQRTPGPETTVARTLLPKPGQSRLRPPGFSALPPARLATFGFVRSSSVSSVSSNQSTDSGHSDPCRPSQRPSSGSDDTPLHLSPVAPSHSCPQAPNAPALHRRSLLPPAQVSPTAGRGGSGSRVRGQECEDGIVQKLRERCEDQARQLVSLQAELKKASLGLEAFIITTQYFCHKSESVIVKERELSLELARIRDEVASSVSQWEILQQDKEELEQRFERELEGLRAQQQSELARLEERLRQYHSLEVQRLEAQQQEQLERLRTQQLEQMEEITENHEAALTEMENSHNDTLVTLKEEHARTVKNLKMAHEQQRKSVEEDFEKLRQSLQDQVDTLTFQNRSLRDRAKRFEEALRRSTDEQIVDALAPYQHIEEDLKSLKEVLLMKNQQIHEQDVKISELERMAQKNVFLEERVQMLHQQNEDLMARIDKNLAMSRQLSEENANLQESMEKESNEKKRLSRNNEELLWRLQSPHMSPAGSPIHRSSAGPGSPARPHSYHQ